MILPNQELLMVTVILFLLGTFGIAVFLAALDSIDLTLAVKSFFPTVGSAIICMAFISCGFKDVGSSHNEISSSSSTDNSVDSSHNGVSSCSRGSTFVCTQEGPGQFVQTEVCENAQGQPVTLSGPEPIDESLAEACPAPEPATVTLEEQAPGTLSQEFAI